jgi:hypothetical protein
VPQQAPYAQGRRGWTGQGKGVDDLGRVGRVLGVQAIQKGEYIAEERIGSLVGQPVVKAAQRAVVGGRAEQWQADEVAHQQIGGQQPLQFTIAARVGPGAHDLGADQLGDCKGGWCALGGRCVVIVGTGGHDRGRVVGLGETQQRVIEAARQDGANELVADPGQDRLQKGAQHPECEWGKAGRAGSASGWARGILRGIPPHCGCDRIRHADHAAGWRL